MCSDQARAILKQPLWLRWISLCQSPLLPLVPGVAGAMAPATPGTSGSSGDWHNEIHLNHSGCFKIARAWSEHIEAVLGGVKTVEPAARRRN